MISMEDVFYSKHDWETFFHMVNLDIIPLKVVAVVAKLNIYRHKTGLITPSLC